MTTGVGQDPGLYGMGLRQIGVQRERPFSGHEAVIDSSSNRIVQNHLPKGDELPGARITGIYFRGAGSQADDRFGPDVIVARPVHQLGGDPYAATCLSNAALEHVTDLELACDFRYFDVPALEHECAVA